MKSVLLITILLALVSATNAAIVFTVNGTVSAAGLGWSSGAPVTFSWTLAGNSPITSGGDPNNYVQWWQYNSGQPQMFASVTGTGLAGTYATPSTPYALLVAYSYNPIYVYTGGGANGLYAPDNSPVTEISTGVTGDFSFSIPPTVPSPDVYFASRLGTYAVTPTSDNYVSAVGGGTMQYTPTSFTIAEASPVPEPGTWAAAAMLLGGAGFAGWRRQRGA